MAADNSTGYHPLTVNECRYLKEGFLADAQCPGLRLVANKTGQKRWVYRRQEGGKLKQETFGYYPKLSLTEAREQWQDLRGKRNRGEPITEGPVYTVKALCGDYIKGYAQRLKRSWKEDERQLWLDIVPVWGERQASTITRPEVISLIEQVATRGDRVAMLLLAVCRKVWNYAIPRDNDVIANPFARLKVIKGVCMDAGEKVSVEHKPTRCLINGRDESDLEVFLDKLPTAAMHQDTRDILMMQLLTACRKGEVCEMRWEDVDAAASRVEANGGEIRKGPLDMGQRGRAVLISDPQREDLVLLRAKGGDPADTEAEIGDWLWDEIWSDDPDRIEAFYKSVVGYDEVVSRGGYDIFLYQGEWRAGIRYVQDKNQRMRWVPVVRVADPEATVQRVP